METSISQRIKMLVKNSGMSINAYAQKVGISQPTLKACIDGSNNPSFDTIQKILIGNPIISSEWLITGEGNMLKAEQTDSLQVASGRDTTGNIIGDGNNVIAGNNLSNVGNSRHYDVPKSGFLKIIYPDGKEETIVGDSSLLERTNEMELLKAENTHLTDKIRMKDELIESMRERILELKHKR